MSQTGTHVYSGRFDHGLDDKNRLTIPSAWRWPHTDSDTFLAMQHPDGYIAVLPPARIAKLLADLAEQSKVSPGPTKALKQKIFSESQSFTFDKQGRFGLSDELLAHAGIKKNAKLELVGEGDTFNIMTPKRWTQSQRATEGQNYSEQVTNIGL